MTARDQAFRFAGEGADPNAGGPGLTVTPTGATAMVSGDESIRQALLLLLGTVPGERVMRPTYGSLLHRLAFAPNDQTTAGLAIHYVRQAVQIWEPRVEMLDVDADADPDRPQRLDVVLRYRVRSSLTTQQLTYPVELGATPTGYRP